MNSYEKATQFRKLHDGPEILVLPNAWDVGSAMIFARAGFPAIATTSAGIAYTLGYPDHGRITVKELVPILARIAQRVEVPVTADIENGYGDTPEAVAETVRAVLQTGVVGINLEDSPGAGDQLLTDLSLQVRKIEAVRAVAAAEGIPLVINARTDVFWLAVGAPDDRLDHAVTRLNAYREAGADCLFAPAVRHCETISSLAARVNGPLNLLAAPGTPPVSELRRLGVARLSVGSGPVRAALSLCARVAEELITHGTYSSFLEESISYREMNRLFECSQGKDV